MNLLKFITYCKLKDYVIEHIKTMTLVSPNSPRIERFYFLHVHTKRYSGKIEYSVCSLSGHIKIHSCRLVDFMERNSEVRDVKLKNVIMAFEK